jgi:hypothetical protein
LQCSAGDFRLAQISTQLNVLTLSRGKLINQGIDWSQPMQGTQAFFDFTAQGAGHQMSEVVGCFCDNSKNTNSVTFFFSYTNQNITIYGGEVATFPCFTNKLPTVKVLNNQDGTANTGYTTIIFTDFDLGYNVAQTGTNANVIVEDNNLALLLASATGGMVGTLSGVQLSSGATGTPTLHRALNVAPSSSVISGYLYQQITLVAGSQQIIAVMSAARGFYIQNLSADPVYIAFGTTTAVAASPTSGAYKLAAGATLTSAMLFGNWVPGGVITAYPTNAGDMLNVCNF